MCVCVCVWSHKPDPPPQKKEESGELHLQAVSCHTTLCGPLHHCLSSNGSLENSERELEPLL